MVTDNGIDLDEHLLFLTIDDWNYVQVFCTHRILHNSPIILVKSRIQQAQLKWLDGCLFSISPRSSATELINGLMCWDMSWDMGGEAPGWNLLENKIIGLI